MNLGPIISLDKVEFIFLKNKRARPIVFLNNRLDPGAHLLIKKEDILYAANVFLRDEYEVIRVRREQANEYHKTNRSTVVKFCDMPRTIRNEILEKAPDTREEDVFVTSKYC